MRQSFDANGIQFVWDSTSLKTADSCQVKYNLQILQGWQPKGEAVHLRFGQHYATALEHFYKRVFVDGEDEETATIGVVEEALTDTWEFPVCPECEGSGRVPDHSYAEEGIEIDDPNPMKDCPNCTGTGRSLEGGKPWDSMHNLKTRESLIRSIVWYLDHFSDEPLPIVLSPEGVPLVEHSFLLPVDNGIVFSGHLDRVVNYSDGIWIMDQKTTGSTISPRYFDSYNPDHQMSMYSFAGKAIFATPVTGVIIDAAQIAVGFTRFERGFTTRTVAQLDEWYDDTMELIEATRTATRNQHFRHNPMSCGNYGGCPFRGICGRSPEVREQFLKGGFDKTEGWDPAARR